MCILNITYVYIKYYVYIEYYVYINNNNNNNNNKVTLLTLTLSKDITNTEVTTLMPRMIQFN